MSGSNINRRKFLGAMGASTASILATPSRVLGALPAGDSLLLEAGQFGNKGGWVLDTQFHNILGFNYLLAHGMGKPVVDARARVRFPGKGTYHVWVHCKDWCPGEWESPGRFQLLVGDNLLPEEFGVNPGWGWQKGSAVDIEETTTTVRLRDLTGFEGRCGAVYFTRDAAERPPDDLEELVKWKRERHGWSRHPLEVKSYDTVIVGGGIAGCAAALSATSQGLKVALIHNRPVLGGNASSEIRVHTLGIVGKAGDILEQINTRHWPNGSPLAHEDDLKRREAMEAADGLDLFLSHTMTLVETSGDTILSLEAVDGESGARTRFKAPVFIDCSGDAWLGYLAGAEFSYGREARSHYDEGWERHGELWSPETPDQRVMGSSVLWRSHKDTTQRHGPFPEVPWAMPVAGNHAALNGEWQWEYSAPGLHQVDDAEAIRDHMFRAIYGCFANAKRRPENAAYMLQFVAYNAGKRESRRLLGDHVYTMKDATGSREFPDAVVTEERAVDIHYQINLLGAREDFLSEALFHKIPKTYYYIPFRSLYSRNIRNLMMAGRCFSCSHVGLGGPRVMNTCGQMGVATGYAAALCRKYNLPPRAIGREHLSELRQLCGYA